MGASANGFATTTSEWLAGSSGGGGGGGECIAPADEYDPTSGIITPAAYARHCVAWRAAGASIIGGCCGVGPEHIRAAAAALGAG